jgi:hypothetical protein
MSVSGNSAYSPFPETANSMPACSTERVRRYRATRAAVRVEVEVPTQDDALAVKRFARQRRQAAAHPAPTTPTAHSSDANLTNLIADLTPAARAAVETFVQALAAAPDRDLIERAGRVAANYEDAVRRSSHGRRVVI